MTLVLDSGALIALERNEREMWVRLKAALLSQEPPVTHAGAVGQVWRGDVRQARLESALRGIDIRSIDESMGRAAGVLIGRARLSDVIDAAVVLVAHDGDHIVTSDPDDIAHLAEAAGRHVEVITT